MNLTKENLIKIHELVQRRFNTAGGIKSEGLIDSIVQRPDLTVSGKICYPDIYSKAASLMETMRWHAFIDGNKRSLLLATQTYLKLNGYSCYFPLHVVRFTVEIADTQGVEEEVVEKLITDISAWLKRYIAKSGDDNHRTQILSDYNKEISEIVNLMKTEPNQAREIVDHWLAIDIYPEYIENAENVMKFINQLYFESIESNGK